MIIKSQRPLEMYFGHSLNVIHIVSGGSLWQFLYYFIDHDYAEHVTATLGAYFFTFEVSLK